MKDTIYKCEVCNKWTTDIYEERWTEISTLHSATISKIGIQPIKIERDSPLHFCSIKCLLEYIATKLSVEESELDITDKILELLETNDKVEIGNITVSTIDEFKVSLEGRMPLEAWMNEVKSLGLNPADYIISNDDGSIINIYRAYYESNQ